MNEAIKEYTSSGKIKRPSYSLIVNWIKESWDAINPNMINCSFKCYSISNIINGTEDDLIFNFNKVEDIINQKRGIEEEEKQNNSENESDDDEMNWEIIIMKIKMITIKVMKIVI